MAKFEKGNKLATGRPKGAKNKASIIAKEAIESIVSDKIVLERLKDELLNLEGKDFVTCYTKLAEFVVPKKAEIEHDVKDEMKEFMAWLSEQ
jgi:hypothetical protein